LGARAAHAAAKKAAGSGAGARTTLVQAGAAWSAEAGGTSGALWGAALTSLGRGFADDRAADGAQLLAGLVEAVEAVERLGGAQPGDKTMIDAAVPFRETLTSQLESAGASAADESASGGSSAEAVTVAARKATEAAEAT